MKKLILPFIVFMSLTAYSQVPNSGLTDEYLFSGGIFNNSAGSDQLTQTGSLLGIESNRAGGSDRAVSLNGDYLQRTSNTAGAFDLSVSFWIKTSTNDANKRVIIDQTERTSDTETSSLTGWYAYLKDGKVGVAGNFQWAKQFVNIVSGTVGTTRGYTGFLETNAVTSISDGSWHHIAVTIFTNGGIRQNGTQIKATYKVYVDNVLNAMNDQIYNAPNHSQSVMAKFVNLTQPISIGNNKEGNSTNAFQEVIDDIRLYNRTIDLSEVTDLFNESACDGTSVVSAFTQNIIVELDEFSNATITPEDIDDGSGKNCNDPLTLSIDKTTFTCDDLGDNVVTLTVTDGFGTATANATVTVKYTPTVSTQNISVQLDASGNATIVPNDINNGSATTGLCGTALNFSLDKTTFTCADLGPITVTLTSDDGNGNAGTANATVTVEDHIAPTIVAQNVSVQVDANLGFVMINTAQVDNGSTDNCDTGSLTMTLSKTKFTCADTGDNTVVLTVEDTQGNIATANVSVTVTSAINDETITVTNMSMCPDGNTGTTISTGSSVVGFNYTLRNSETNSIVNGPIAGTGNALDFTTGNLSETTVFNVLAEKTLATTQSALDFDGVNDYVSLGTDNRGISSQVTVAAWVKTTASGATQFIASKYVNPLGYYLYIDANGKAGISGRNNTAAVISSGVSTKSVNDGEWHYITGSVNASTGVSSVYVDGVLENATNNSIGTSIAGSADLLLGLTSALYFTGEMEQVTLWNTALDATAILASMNSCLSGSETNIVGHFIFEGGSGTTLTDQSSLALNGTLTNMDGATDWVQVVSPSCGDKSCDYQLSTEVTIGDAIAPTALAQDIAAQIDVNTGDLTITPDLIDNGSTDNCTSLGNLIYSLDKTSFTCEDVGENEVTLTITDESGNESMATATITISSAINDETVTTANNTSFCPDGSSATISTGSSVVGVNYSLRDSRDNSVVEGPIAGTGSGLDFNTGAIHSTTSYNILGSLNVAGGALDFDGGDDYVSLGNINRGVSTEVTVATWMKTSASGASNFFAGKFDFVNGWAFFVDSNGKISLDGRDGTGTYKQSGLSTTSVNDNQWHYIVGSINVSTGMWKIYVDGVLESSANNGVGTTLSNPSFLTFGAFNTSYFTGQIDQFAMWNTELDASTIASFNANCISESENSLVALFDVDKDTGTTVIDHSMNASNGIMINMDASTDRVAGDLACVEICSFQMSNELTIGDGELPIANAQDITVQLDADGNAVIAASDVNDGSSDNCTETSSLVFNLDQTTFDCTDLGANTVTLMVEDLYGNQSTTIATITIEDVTAPTVMSQNIILQLDANGNVDVDPTAVNNGSTDNCTAVGNLVLSLSKTDFTCTDLGVNTITLTVTDGSTNQVSTTATVTIEDRVAPTASAQDITVQLDADGIASILVTDINNGSTDNCTSLSNLTYSLDQTDFACADIGVNVVTLTVLDDSANQSTVTATVTVEDSIAPTAIVQDLSLVMNGASSITITPEDIDNGSSDICDVTLSLDMDTFTAAQIGEHTVTLTVEDASGNMTTATATVTVIDKTDQTIIFDAIADKTFGDDSFEITASASSQLLVVFSVVSGPITFSDGTVSIIGAGQAIIRASQAGDATFAPIQIDRTFNIAKADQLITIEPITDMTVAASTITISASVDTNLILDYVISGPGTIVDNVVSLDGTIGIVGVTVTQPGNDNYNPISQTINFNVVNQTAQTIVFSSIADKTYGDDEFNLTASSDSELTVNLELISGPVTLSGSTLSITGTGEVIVEATQEGDVTFLGAAAVRQHFMVNKAMLTATAEDISITYGTAVPELVFGYVGFVNGESASVLGVEPTISTTVASDVNGANAGTYVITLDGGQADNYSITLVNGTLDVAKADQQITASPIDTKLTFDTDFEVVASVDTDLELIYAISGPASISGTTVSLDGDVGVVTITITQLGNINYNETSETLNFDVAVPAGIGNDLLEIKIFPNPSTSYIQIETPKTENLRAIMFDLNGSLLWSKPISSINNQFDVSSLKVGAYILKIQSEDHSTTTTTKILIER